MIVVHSHLRLFRNAANPTVLHLGNLAELSCLGNTKTVFKNFTDGFKSHTRNLRVAEIHADGSDKTDTCILRFVSAGRLWQGHENLRNRTPRSEWYSPFESKMWRRQ